MTPRSTQHLAADMKLPGAEAGESADLRAMSGTGAESQLAHSPGSSCIPGVQPSKARTYSSMNCSQTESIDVDGERQPAAVERAEPGRRAAASGIDANSDGGLGQLLSEQQLWDAAWRALEPCKAHQHLSSPDRLLSRPGGDAVQGEVSPSSFPSLAARLFGVGSRSRRRDQRCAQLADHAELSRFGTSPACRCGRPADAAGG